MIAPGSARKKIVFASALVVLLAASGAIQLRILHLKGKDLTVPFAYGGDAVAVEIAVKTIVERGEWLDNPSLGLPGAMNTRDFPTADLAHLTALRILALFTHHWGLVMNLYFMLSCCLTASASWLVMCRLRIAQMPAFAASLLYAFLPYHFIRGQAHLFLGACYAVPVAAFLMLRVMEGVPLFYQRSAVGSLQLRLTGRRTMGTVLLCALIGSSGIYYAFFSCFFLLVGGALTAHRRRTTSNLVAAGIAIGLVVAVVGLNMLPSIRYRLLHGSNATVATRSASEAEVFGLKLAQLVLPLTGHRIKAFAALKDQYNRAPLVNENDASTLGLLGTFGFVALLLRMVLKWRHDGRDELWESLSILNLAAILLGVVGGIGSIFAILITPQLRGYNRISIFIGFFSLVAVAMLYERAAARFGNSPGGRLGAMGLLIGIVLCGLYDQTTPAFAAQYDAFAAEYRQDDAYVKSLEAALPANARIFQLPYFSFPERTPLYHIPDYAMAKPFLHSRALRWSYGAMRGREADLWQQHVVAKPTGEMLETLALAGFDALYVDRFGYEDNGAALEGQIAHLLKRPPLVSQDGRMAVYDLGPFASLLARRYPSGELALRKEVSLHPILAGFGKGFYDEENHGTVTWRWSMASSELVLYNDADHPLTVTVAAVLYSGGEGPTPLVVNEGSRSEVLQMTGRGTPFSRRLAVPPGRYVISFATEAKPVEAAADPRVLVFRVADARIHREEEAKLRPVELAWRLGCYPPEGRPEGEWRWCRGKGELMLDNPGLAPAKILLSARLKTGYPKPAAVTFESDVLNGRVAVNSNGMLLEKELVVPPGQHLIRFESDAKRVRASRDPREMVLRFENAHIERIP